MCEVQGVTGTSAATAIRDIGYLIVFNEEYLRILCICTLSCVSKQSRAFRDTLQVHQSSVTLGSVTSWSLIAAQSDGVMGMGTSWCHSQFTGHSSTGRI